MALAFFFGGAHRVGEYFFFGFRLGIPLGSGGTRSDATPLSSPLAILRTFPLFCIILSWISLTLPYLWTCLTTPTQFSFNRLLACLKPPPLENTMYPLPELVLTLKGHFVFHFSPPSNQWKKKKQVIRENSHFTGESCQIVPPSQKASELTGSFAKWKDHSYHNI